MSETEIRTFATKCEIREGAEGEAPVLVGIAPPWDTLSTEGALPGFREQFERGAFGSLRGAEVVATLEHDNRAILGRTPKTLKLEDTDEGLRYEITLDPERSQDSDLIRSVKRGDITGSSFEFITKEKGDRWVEEDGAVIRTVKKRGAMLRQVGPVVSPAYKDAPKVALRCAQKVKDLTGREAREAAERDAAARRRELDLAEAEAML